MIELSLHILDIVQNSIEAKAALIQISVTEDIISDRYVVTISDNGKGIKKEMLATVTDAYTTSRTTRKVGMGLALLKQSAEQAGGELKVESEFEKGTIVIATFVHSNIDRPPLGDIAGTVSLLASANPEIDFVFRHCLGIAEYCFDTREVKVALDDVSISELSIRKYLKEIIHENLLEIGVDF